MDINFPHSETTFETTISDIETKKDKNNNDYWVIRTSQPNFQNQKTFIAFSQDRDLENKTKSLLENYPEQLINRPVKLTVKEKTDKEGKRGNKVIGIKLLIENYEPTAGISY